MLPGWFWVFPGAIHIGFAGSPLWGWWLREDDKRVVRKNRGER